MKKIFFILLLSATTTVILINSCTTQRETYIQKSDAELWAQNCIRCHNIPSPTSYTDVQWETIGLHMRERANMTDEQIKKIVAFLQKAN